VSAVAPSVLSLERAPVTRREAILVVAIVAIAAALRFAYPSRIAVEHWDEAVYASNHFTDDGYPKRHLYAPPLLPAAIEWSMIVFGSSSFAAVLPNLIVGTLTVPLCWWAARGWFGPAAGHAAATLAALSDFHILYSRTALTDPMLCFFFLLAVYCGWRALAAHSLGWAVVAGVATGAAWATKYNGWLPLAVTASGFVAWAAFERRDGRVWVSGIVIVSTMAVVAGLCFIPSLRSLPEGYGEVARNHAKYFVGLAGWWESFRRQVGFQRHLNGMLTVYGIALACVLPPMMGWGHRRLEARRPLSAFGRLAAWLVAAWFVGLFASVPAYTPYSRLALPWVVSAWLAAAAVIGRIFDGAPPGAGNRSDERGARSESRWAARSVWLYPVALALAVGAGYTIFLQRVPGWQDRTGRARTIVYAAQKASGLLSADKIARPPAFVAYGEPAIFFHLKLHGEAASPVVDFSFLRPGGIPFDGATFVMAYEKDDFEELIAPYSDRLERIDSFEDTASDVVLLDSYDPEAIRPPDERPREQLRLYRVKK
jgi:4-amino-4-deoxy-L-arabinose transferase-like glycosyltransferase